MSHFADARRQTEDYFKTDAAVRTRLLRVCLIWDLQGRLRLLAEPQAGQDPEALRRDLSQAAEQRARPFWTGDVWISSEASSDSEKVVYEAAWSETGSNVLDPGPPEVRTLERHVSKDAWFVPQVMAPWPLRETTPPILSFFSFKGGVGRTTALPSLAVQLARAGKRVVLIDLDLEAPGLLSALPPPAGSTPPAGVLDFLLERPLVDSWHALQLDEFYYTVDGPQIVGDGVPIRVVPAGPLDELYLQKLARLNYGKIYALSTGHAERSPFVELIRFAKVRLGAEYVLLDSRAGFHDLGGLALSGVSHLDVLFGLDSEQSWRGLELVVRFLGRDRLERNLTQLDCALVHALAPAPGEERDLASGRFRERAYDLFSAHYYDEPDAVGEWPLPALDAEDSPHYPALLGFDPLVQRYQAVADVADRLTQGDFRPFAERILARVGRELP
jgi:hypothetical protein